MAVTPGGPRGPDRRLRRGPVRRGRPAPARAPHRPHPPDPGPSRAHRPPDRGRSGLRRRGQPADLRAARRGRPRRWSGPRPGRHCTRPLWHSAIPRRGAPLEFRSEWPADLRACTCLPWVAKTWLLAPTPLAIFFSSIEMANSPTLHAVIFRIGALICAAPAGIVREILPRLPATRIPGCAGGDRRAGQRPGQPAHRARRPRPPPAAAPARGRGRDRGRRGRGRRYGLGVGQVLDFLEVPGQLGRRARPSCPASIPGW